MAFRRRDNRVLGIRRQVAGIGAEAVAALAPEQPVDRQARGLAEDIPERDVDAADRLDHHAASTVGRAVVVHRGPKRVDVARVLADQHLFQALAGQLRDRGVDDCLQDERDSVCLANSHDSGIRVHPDDEHVLQAVAVGEDRGQAEHDGFDVGDDHETGVESRANFGRQYTAFAHNQDGLR